MNKDNSTTSVNSKNSQLQNNPTLEVNIVNSSLDIAEEILAISKIKSEKSNQERQEEQIKQDQEKEEQKRQQEQDKSSSQSHSDAVIGLSVTVATAEQSLKTKTLYTKSSDFKENKNLNIEENSSTDNLIQNNENLLNSTSSNLPQNNLILDYDFNLVNDNGKLLSQAPGIGIKNSDLTQNRPVSEKAVEKNVKDAQKIIQEKAIPDKGINKAIANFAINENQVASIDLPPINNSKIQNIVSQQSSTNNLTSNSTNSNINTNLVDNQNNNQPIQDKTPTQPSITQAKTYFISTENPTNSSNLNYVNGKFIINNFNANLDKIDFDFDPYTYYPGNFIVSKSTIDGISGVEIKYFSNPNFLSLFITKISLSELKLSNFSDWDIASRPDIFKISYLIGYQQTIDQESSSGKQIFQPTIDNFEMQQQIIDEIDYIKDQDIKKTQSSQNEVPDDYYSDDADYDDYENDSQLAEV